uniref:Uncharacterized protein n=1 Tax=Chromera velia CCMP2878 TaxID=1169474 RepID=A0A0G4G4K3_9ALVE|eukprot:Cvel_20222.t1-p1 / transcript=Cvel_20222.t1 / gene=Cvel_20222 / organism=Chromera_velia_CCMP2878 / gene_product=hypothetical protein / transcript_product=hypothetical protein / location=Cvel_scaffold1800:19314-25283(+) / protein_length=530 / sequence_SO=supercontig / SO=protein_coding / is_pseudo=false
MEYQTSAERTSMEQQKDAELSIEERIQQLDKLKRTTRNMKRQVARTKASTKVMEKKRDAERKARIKAETEQRQLKALLGIDPNSSASNQRRSRNLQKRPIKPVGLTTDLEKKEPCPRAVAPSARDQLLREQLRLMGECADRLQQKVEEHEKKRKLASRELHNLGGCAGTYYSQEEPACEDEEEDGEEDEEVRLPQTDCDAESLQQQNSEPGRKEENRMAADRTEGDQTEDEGEEHLISECGIVLDKRIEYPPACLKAIEMMKTGIDKFSSEELRATLRETTRALQAVIKQKHDEQTAFERTMRASLERQRALRQRAVELHRQQLELDRRRSSASASLSSGSEGGSVSERSSSASHGSIPQGSAEEDESKQQLAALGEAAQARFADVREVEATVAECRAKGLFETAELLREEQESGLLVQAVTENIQSIPNDMSYEDFEALQRERLGLPLRRRDDQTAVPIEKRGNDVAANEVECQLRQELKEKTERDEIMKKRCEEIEDKIEETSAELQRERRARLVQRAFFANRGITLQ